MATDQEVKLYTSTTHQSEPQTAFSEVSKRYRFYDIHHYGLFRKCFYFVVLFGFVFPYLWFKDRYRILNEHNIPSDENHPYIVVANHISMADPPFVSLILKIPVAYMAKKELYYKYWLAEILFNLGTVALNRDAPDTSTIKSSLNAIKAGWCLGIFPEGTRSKSGQLLEFKKGYGGIAQKTKRPVLPIGIFKDHQGRLCGNVGKLIHDVSDVEKLQQEVLSQIELLIQGKEL